MNDIRFWIDLCEAPDEPAELVNEVSPKGWEGTVKAMKKHKEISNPWALSYYMKNKGYHSHKGKKKKS